MTFRRKIDNLLFVGLSNIFRKNGHVEFISEKKCRSAITPFSVPPSVFKIFGQNSFYSTKE